MEPDTWIASSLGTLVEFTDTESSRPKVEFVVCAVTNVDAVEIDDEERVAFELWVVAKEELLTSVENEVLDEMLAVVVVLKVALSKIPKPTIKMIIMTIRADTPNEIALRAIVNSGNEYQRRYGII